MHVASQPSQQRKFQRFKLPQIDYGENKRLQILPGDELIRYVMTLRLLNSLIKTSNY